MISRASTWLAICRASALGWVKRLLIRRPSPSLCFETSRLEGFDLCKKCGREGLAAAPYVGVYSVPFPVHYCQGCDRHETEMLHRTCPKCGHVVLIPTVDGTEVA